MDYSRAPDALEASKRGLALDPIFELVTVGTGSPLYKPERSRACTMISYGGKLFLVDLGEGTTAIGIARQRQSTGAAPRPRRRG